MRDRHRIENTFHDATIGNMVGLGGGDNYGAPTFTDDSGLLTASNGSIFYNKFQAVWGLTSFSQAEVVLTKTTFPVSCPLFPPLAPVQKPFSPVHSPFSELDAHLPSASTWHQIIALVSEAMPR